MPPKRKLRKIIDEVSSVRCAAGRGLIREEVWEGVSGEVARYNLAFINHFLTTKDHGRVLGYDNAHGEHERHFYGQVDVFCYTSYAAVVEKFQDEVGELRKEVV